MSTRLRPSSRSSEINTMGAASAGAGDVPRRKQNRESSRAESSQSRANMNGTPSFPSLEILQPGDTDGMPDRSSSRISIGSRSRSTLGSVPPRSDSSLSQRVATPTKHVSLTAVRRKQESDQPFEPELDWREFTRSNSSLKLGERSLSSTFLHSESVEEETSTQFTYTEDSIPKEESQAISSDNTLESEVTSQMQAVSMKGDGKTEPEEQKESSDDDEDESDSDDEPRKAPNELLMEFLDCVMKKDFKNAEKLCRMILIYEPNNPEALTFHPIIMEKLLLDQQAAEAGEEDGSGDEDDDEEGDDDDDDDDDDSDEDSSLENDSSDDNDNDDEAEEGAVQARPDSGIGM